MLSPNACPHPRALRTPSPRSHPALLQPLAHPGHFVVKRVTGAGTIRFKHRLLFLSHALASHLVGLEEIDDGLSSLYFGSVLLCRLDEQAMRMYG